MSLCGTHVSRVRAELGSKGDCVLKSTYLAGDPFLPPPRSNKVHCQAASKGTAGCEDYCGVGELTAVYPRDLGRRFVRLSRFWWWFWLWHACGIICASSHIHWCVDCSEDHESVLSVFVV